MENLVLGCKCNNQEELIKCLALLKRCGLKWKGDSKLEVDIDLSIKLLQLTAPITIFCYRDDFHDSKDFIVTYSYVIEKYGYTKTSQHKNKTYYVTTILKFAKFLEHYKRWKNQQK